MTPQEEIRSFLDGSGRLLAYPAKRKKQLFALLYLATKFEAGRVYTESEVNDLIDEHTCFHDPATVRRELYNVRFLEREPNGTAYRLAAAQPTAEILGIA